jgi:hypothetical protein
MDVTISAGFSGRPYDLRMRIYTIENNVGANYSRYRGDRYAYSRSGYGSFANNAYACESWIAGHYAGGSYSLPFAPGDYAGKTIGLGSYDTGAVWHDGNGNVSFTSRIRMLNASVFGSADTGDVWMAGDRLPMAPGAPGQPSVSNTTPTSLTLSWTAASRGRADITNYHWQILNAAATAVVMEVIGGVFYSDNTADNGTLTPGTSYLARVRAANGDGWGPFSSARSFSTLPSTPPGMDVDPFLSGTKATVNFTPPGGATGVTKYRVQYRPLGGSSTSKDTTTNTTTVDGLSPGGTYEWRASAFFGDYQSPWTDWEQHVQPNPNTNPGNYFDGSTAPRDDLTFSWSGTANNSTSLATGVGVDGWAQDSGATGATLRLHRVTGGRSGTYAARLRILTDAAGAGAGLGMIQGDGTKSAVVEELATYVLSIYVRPSRPQRMRAVAAWSTAAGATVGAPVFGDSVLVTDTVGWTRLTVVGVVPAGARRAVVKAYDVEGDGWVAWKSGEWVDADDAMVSLSSLFDWFSGDTPDTPGFDYTWLGTPNASQSARLELPLATDDPLADPDCPPMPAPPQVPTVPSDCIEEIGTWRRYVVQVPASAVRRWTASLPTLVLSTGNVAERQVRIRYFSNPDEVQPSQLSLDDWEAEQILTYIPPNTDVTLDGVTQLVWAEVAGRPPISADKLLYGTGGMPASWPELSCGNAYVITLDVPLEAPSGNLTTRLLITQRT